MLRHWVIHVFISWAINAFALVLTAKIIPSIKLKGIGSAFLATFVLGALNATLLRVLWVVMIPFTILTLGLFLFVLNGAMLKLTAAKMVPQSGMMGESPMLPRVMKYGKKYSTTTSAATNMVASEMRRCQNFVSVSGCMIAPYFSLPILCQSSR